MATVKAPADATAPPGEPLDSVAGGLSTQGETQPMTPTPQPKWIRGPRPKVQQGIVRGARHPRAVFASDEEVRQLKLAAKAGWTARELAAHFKKKLPTVQAILAGKTWKHVLV
jgi:hypothetical protein